MTRVRARSLGRVNRPAPAPCGGVGRTPVPSGPHRRTPPLPHPTRTPHLVDPRAYLRDLAAHLNANGITAEYRGDRVLIPVPHTDLAADVRGCPWHIHGIHSRTRSRP